MKTAAHLDALFRPVLFQSTLYNELPSIEEASSVLSASPLLDLAQREIRSLFLRHGVVKFCGMNLLHRHWSVGRGELPLQERRVIQGKPALVTEPADKPHPSAVAASWFVNPSTGDLLPLEFSTDSRVAECAAQLKAKPRFFVDAAETLIRNGLENSFGICVAMREALSQDLGEDWIETTESGRKSVVMARRPDSLSTGSLVRTVWIFAEEEGGAACQTACFRASDCVEIINFPGPQTRHDSVEGPHQMQHDVGPA